jgi:acylphosphatase
MSLESCGPRFGLFGPHRSRIRVELRPMATERRRVRYSGRVQGVGFRFTSLRLAQSFQVSGYVRNLDDGRVELVAEGDADQVRSFLDSIRSALGDKIRDAESQAELPGSTPFDGFTIRY